MRILLDIVHPAQVHLFRNVIQELKNLGHTTCVTSREKEMTTELLDAFGIEHSVISTKRSSTLSLVQEGIIREFGLFRKARDFNPDVMVSRLNPVTATVSTGVGCENIMLKSSRLKSPVDRFAYRFCDTLCIPSYLSSHFDDENKIYMIDSVQQISYLHPNYFQPDPKKLYNHGVSPNNTYFVLRFVSWTAHHDIGNSGFSLNGKKRLIEELSKHGEVYISSEEELPDDFINYKLPIDPEDIFNLLYFADGYVGDSGSMSIEAGLLGTPSVRVNMYSDEEQLEIFKMLDDEYDLVQSYSSEKEVINAIHALATDGSAKDRWRGKTERVISDQDDFTKELVNIIVGDANV